MSDGAPVDDSTLDANANWNAENLYPILSDHLLEVIAAIDNVPNTQVAGFGIDHDVAFYEDNDRANTATDSVERLSEFVRRIASCE